MTEPDHVRVKSLAHRIQSVRPDVPLWECIRIAEDIVIGCSE